MIDLMSVETSKADTSKGNTLTPLLNAGADVAAAQEGENFDLVFAQDDTSIAAPQELAIVLPEADDTTPTDVSDPDLALAPDDRPRPDTPLPIGIGPKRSQAEANGQHASAETLAKTPQPPRGRDSTAAPAAPHSAQLTSATSQPANGQTATIPSLPTAIIPHAVGSKGPDTRTTQAEDLEMQLSRPNRVRSYTAPLARMALQDASPPPSVTKDATTSLRPVPNVAPTLGDGQDTPRDAPNQSSARSQPEAAPLPTRTPSLSEAVALARAAAAAQGDAPRPKSTTASTTSTTTVTDAAGRVTPPAPQVVAAYTSLAPQPAQPAASKTTLQDDPGLPRQDSLSARPMDQTMPPTDLTRTAQRAAPAVSPEQLAHQLAQVAQNTALHRRDILLQPEELGRVRLNLQAHENSVHVAILVERPETLDLMRRYIGQLSDEFRALGYDDVSFDFAQQNSGDSDTSSTPSASASDYPEPEETSPLPTITHPGLQKAGTLDLRI